MEDVLTSDAIHPLGEGEFHFETAGGKVRMSMTEDTLTPFGGFVPWAAFTRHLGVVEKMAKNCPVVRTSPNAAPVYDILQSFMLTALSDGRRFSHIERLREDPTVAEIFGMESVVSDDTVRRFIASIDPVMGAEWIARHAAQLWRALPDNPIMDWDSTVVTKFGNQEGAEVGYNPTRPGRKSFHPLLGVIAGTRMCPAYRFRPGNTVTSTDWSKAMEDATRWLGERRVWLNRGDNGLGNEAVMAWHEQPLDLPYFLFRLKLTKGVRTALHRMPEERWVGSTDRGALQVSEALLQLDGWTRPRRVVFSRKLQGVIPAEDSREFWDQNKHEFGAYVTNLPEGFSPWQVVVCYRERADVENVFDELKNQWGFSGFCSKRKAVTETAARLLLLVYNLWVLFVRFIQPKQHTEAKRGRRWFLIIAARLVKSGRQRELQVSISGGWAKQMREGYLRLHEWIRTTAPQLKILSPSVA
jgi:transposase